MLTWIYIVYTYIAKSNLQGRVLAEDGRLSEQGGSRVFNCGIAVAPVTEWQNYGRTLILFEEFFFIVLVFEIFVFVFDIRR